MDIIGLIKKWTPWRRPIIRLYLKIKQRLRLPAAYIWRFFLFRTTIIAVSGSTGKTSTKELLAAILSSRFATAKTNGTWGGFRHGGVVATVLSVRPWHRYAVIETAIETPGQMERMARLLKPDMVVMLTVMSCHTNKFRNLDAIAQEKAQLLRVLAPEKIAVLNGDDPLVKAMRAVGSFQVRYFGSSQPTGIWATESRSHWPARLECQVHTIDETHRIRTSLVGTHWVTAILAALTAGRCCGIPLAAAIKSIEAYQPFWARMQPVTLPRGATFIRDEWNGSIATFEVAFQVLENATADRKLMVVSDFSDSKRKPRDRVKRLGREAARRADMVIFVGDRGSYGVKAAIAAGMKPDNAYAFFTVQKASEFLKGELRKGDLVLLKGRTSDHLSRIFLAQLGSVTCELETCSRQHLCDRCGDLGFQWTPELEGLMAPPNLHV
jgi:UDP-N-acetylmuramoyl-tripeptide--D-alanyl-D-alanine ligase